MKQQIISAAHWGALKVSLENGKIVASEPAIAPAVENELASVVAEQVYSQTRIKAPMVRRQFLQNFDRSLRGKDEWVELSWQQALDLVHQQIMQVRCKFGADSIFAGSYGWKSSGSLHSSRNLLHRYMNLTGGFVNSFSDYSTGAAQHILPHIIGGNEVYEQPTSWEQVLENTQQIILWGANPINTLRNSWTATDQQGIAYFKKFQQTGKPIICIDPIRNESCQQLGAQWIPIHTATDVPLILAMAYTLIQQNLHDKSFLQSHCVGFAQFEQYVLGHSDNQPKTPQWASQICGVPAQQIEWLVLECAKRRTMIMPGWGLQRQRHGEQTPWALVVLAAMLGQIGLAGGGIGFSYSNGNGGVPRSQASPIAAISAMPNSIKTPPVNQSIIVSKLTDALLNPGKTIDFNGKKLTYPEIKLIYWAGGNPLVHHQDTNQMLRAWQKPDCIIVNEINWTPTARMADIVLPVTTSFERNDLIVSGSFSMSSLIPMRQLVAPQFQAKNDYDIFLELAQRAGVGEQFSENKSEMQWLEQFYQLFAAQLKVQSAVEIPSFFEFWQRNQPLQFQATESNKKAIRYQQFRQNPEQNPLRTESGKIEIFCQRIAEMNYQDCGGYPTWLEPEEFIGSTNAEYPLALVTPHSYYRLHSQLAHTSLRQKYAIHDREPVMIHPQDAAARGIQTGDIVRIRSPRGQVLAGALVSADIIAGNIALHEGAWFDPTYDENGQLLCKNGSPNVLTRDEGSSKLAQGNCANTCIVEIEKYLGAAPEVTVFQPPRIYTQKT